MIFYFYGMIILIIAFFLTKGNNTNKLSSVEVFKPLTYIEIKRKKPFIAVFGNKWVYQSNMLKTSDLTLFWHQKDIILHHFNLYEEEKDSISKPNLSVALFLLRELLYKVGQKPRGWIKKIQYRRSFHKYFESNTEDFINLFNQLSDYQTRLFFLLKQIVKKEIIQSKVYSRTPGDPSLLSQTDGIRPTSNIFLNVNTQEKLKEMKSKRMMKQKKKVILEQRSKRGIN